MKKLFFWMLCNMLFSLTASAGQWDEAMYRQIEQSIQVPQFANKAYLVTKFGGSREPESHSGGH